MPEIHVTSPFTELFIRRIRLFQDDYKPYIEIVVRHYRKETVMKLEIRTHGIELTESLRAQAEKRLGFGLDWTRHEVSKVMLRLSDINGPRGGNDKRCQLRIPLPGMRDIVIEDTDADLHIAIDRAIDRAARTLERRLSRRREFGPLPTSHWEQLPGSA
jgi:putative sigma-54 modulation protein